MKTYRLRWFVQFVLISLLLVLSACQAAPVVTPDQQGEDAAQPTVAAQEGPRETITIFRGGVTLDWDADPILLAIEDRMNVDIKFLTADWGEIPQVRNLALSTEEDVDIYHHMDTNQRWIDDELIIPLDDYINAEDHPYLYALTHSPLFAPMKRNGQTYYIPMISDGSDWVLLTRLDWMEELGLEMPTNEVEYRALLQAFKDRDPDPRNVGMQVEGGQTIRRSMVPILNIHGVPANFPNVDRNYWVDDNGTLAPVITSENVKAALSFMNGLYQDGLINTDFPTLSSFPQLSETYIQAGKAGVSWFPNGGNFPMPGARTGFIPPFSATGFEHTRSEGIPTQGWISISSVSDSPQKAIDLLEFFNSLEGRKLLTLGIEDVHYNNLDADGNFDRITENWDYALTYYPLHFYLGNGTARGYVPLGEYATIEEGMANVQIWQPRGGLNIRETLAASSQWVGAPMMFQYVEFPELSDTQTALVDAIVTGWTKLITVAPADFENEWQNYLAALESAGHEEWNQTYQAYYDEHLK
jgi:putative aldouronate transport system substrate-binding protein